VARVVADQDAKPAQAHHADRDVEGSQVGVACDVDKGNDEACSHEPWDAFHGMGGEGKTDVAGGGQGDGATSAFVLDELRVVVRRLAVGLGVGYPLALRLLLVPWLPYPLQPHGGVCVDDGVDCLRCFCFCFCFYFLLFLVYPDGNAYLYRQFAPNPYPLAFPCYFALA